MIWGAIYKRLRRPAVVSIINGEERISIWDSLYKGKPDWLTYQYVDMLGYKREKCRKSMNPAKLLTSELSGLIWAERPELETDKSIEEILEANAFWGNMQQKTDRLLALGGMAVKLYVVDKVIKLDYVPAGRFIPVSWDNKRIYEADFIDRKVKGGKDYVRIEQHRKAPGGYLITHKAFEETWGGGLMPANLDVFDIEEAEVFVSTTEPMFVYIRNPEENNFDVGSPLGISMYANALDTMESLDIAFDSLQSEIVLGKRRIIVPTDCIRTVVDPNTEKATRYFDPSDEVYQAFDLEDAQQKKITDNTVPLRITEIKEAIQTLLNILSVQVGFSAGYITFDGSAGLKTATEIISENSKTWKTKKTYENALGDGIVNICNSIRALGESYSLSTGNGEYTISWNDSIIEDRNAKTDYWIKRLQAKTTPLYRVLMALDGLGEEEAKKKAEEIRGESATVDVNKLFGGAE